MTTDMRAIIDALKGKRLPLTDEKECQRAILQVLSDLFIPVRREVKISGGVIDFLVGSVGVEVKLKGAAALIRRQIVRYCADQNIEGVVLLTAKPVDLAPLLRGKPVHEFDISRAWL